MPDEIKDDLMRRVEQEAEGFSVHDDSTANWLVRKIAECRAYRERIERWAALEMKRAEREEAFFMTRFGGQLETWARRQIAKQRGRKSIKLPAGTVGFRTEPTRLAVKDEPALLAWCKANLPDAIQTIQRVLKSSVKDHIGGTGEIPDGTEIAGGQQKFFIK
jgi:hypothetical protein